MSKKRKFAIVVLLIIFVSTTPIFARVKTKHFSAYAACQHSILSVKGNKAWEYQHTKPEIFSSAVYFWDGYNQLDCYSHGIGPFWIVTLMVWGCRGNTDEICPPDMFDDYID